MSSGLCWAIDEKNMLQTRVVIAFEEGFQYEDQQLGLNLK